MMNNFIYLFQIIGGPQVCLRLIANVTMPDMEISTDILEFGEVRCGECRVVTVQLHNHKHVDCEWNSHPTEREKRKVEYSDFHNYKTILTLVLLILMVIFLFNILNILILLYYFHKMWIFILFMLM